MYYRTDLAVEAHTITRGEAKEIEGVVSETEELYGLPVTTVEIINEAGEKALGKSIGKYITIEASDIKYSQETYESASKILSSKIRELAGNKNDTLTLVAGLGNDDITPDKLGNMTIDRIMVTNHMKKHAPDVFTEEISPVCAIAPGVLGTTGMETFDVIKGICDRLSPDLIIVVDALAAADFKRIGVTLQITDAGIQPGAGVGNNRHSISKKELGIPVVAIGVPTVVDAMSLLGNDRNKDTEPLIVTPRDIDLIIERCAKAISGGINLALHDGITLRDAEEYVS